MLAFHWVKLHSGEVLVGAKVAERPEWVCLRAYWPGAHRVIVASAAIQHVAPIEAPTAWSVPVG